MRSAPVCVSDTEISGLLVEYAAEGCEDILYGVVALNLAVVAVALVVGDQGLGLVVVGGYAVLDDAAVGVVLAAFDLGAVQDALVDELVGEGEGEDCVDLAAELGEHGVEGLCLGDGAGESVEEEARNILIGGYLVADHAFNHFVGYEVSAVDELSGFLAELCAGGHLLTQEVSCGEVKIMVFLDDLFGLGAFAGSRRTEKNVVFHDVYLMLKG